MTPRERRRRALDRGLFLAERVERVASATWLVPSQSGPSGIHAVALIDGYLRCDCFASLAGPVRASREQEPDAPAALDVRRSA
jgi:hypothetical protein